MSNLEEQKLIRAADGARGITDEHTTMKDHLANAAAPFAWGAWIFGHIAQINQILQGLAFSAAIVASIAATWYHVKKGREPK